LLGGRFPYQKNGLLDHTHLKFYGREDLEALLRECGLLWQHWHTVQVDPAQAELKAYWQQLGEADQAFLKAKCADGDVYQHVVRAQPAIEAAHFEKLASEHKALVQQNKSETQELNAKYAAQEHDWNAKYAAQEQDWNEKYAAQQKSWLEEKDLTAAQHEAALKSMAAQLEGVAAKEQNTQATLAWTESQLQNHKQSIQELHLEIEALKQSTSWRITSPLRRLLSKISN